MKTSTLVLISMIWLPLAIFSQDQGDSSSREVPIPLNTLMATGTPPVNSGTLFSLLHDPISSPVLFSGWIGMSARSMLWPGLPENHIRIQRLPDFSCPWLTPTAEPKEELWQVQPDGGLVRMGRYHLEYDAPAIVFD